MVSMFLGNFIDVNEVQSSNAKLPIEVTESGISIVSKLLQFENIPWDIAVSEFGSTID